MNDGKQAGDDDRGWSPVFEGVSVSVRAAVSGVM